MLDIGCIAADSVRMHIGSGPVECFGDIDKIVGT